MRMPRNPSGLSSGISVEIVTAIAERECIDPTELTPPLSTVIDADALGRLVRSAGDGASVIFEYRDWEIEVESPGDITLRSLADGE